MERDDSHHTALLPCADSNRLQHASPIGTATHAQGWLLLECPGPWRRDVASTLGFEATDLLERAGAAGVRLQLIRAPGSHARTDDRPLRAILVHTGPAPWMETSVVTAATYSDIPVEQAAATQAPGFGGDVDGDVLLVCTHGTRDRCCATFGRGIAAALAARLPGQVWETSHVGGHRFAGNLVVLPEGLMFGGLDAQGALAVVDDLSGGQLPLAPLRGRSNLQAAAQAAEILTRQRLGTQRRGDVSAHIEETDGVTTQVTVQIAGEAWQARVARVEAGTPMRLSCDHDELSDPGRWELVSLTPSQHAT